MTQKLKWIPKNRPPKESGRVFVTDGDNVGEAIYYKENKKNKYLSVDLNNHYNKVKYWMPIPKSPNELKNIN